jgi:hypothetical protein
MEWRALPTTALNWMQSAGGASALILFLFTFIALVRSQQSSHQRTEAIGPGVLLLCLLFPPVAFLLWLSLTGKKRWLPSERALHLPMLYLGSTWTIGFYEAYGLIRLASWGVYTESAFLWRNIMLSAAGLCAFIMVVLPVVTSFLFNMRFGRIWALARLSFKQAVRSRVVLIFSLMGLVFLFFDFFADHSKKADDQLKNFVTVIYWSMTPLFLMTASILGAFNLPADIKNQSIHTIVTKPVEKLEIALGRFFGFAGILTLGLLVVTAVSYLYILRGVTPEARIESFRARVPIFGNSLYFFGTKKEDKGDNVGREWDYRSYIKGAHPQMPTAPKDFAVWEFEDLPESMDNQEWITFEFTFDIFRLTKGLENQPIFCTFTFTDARHPIPDVERKMRQTVHNKYGELITQAAQAKPGEKNLADSKEKIDLQLASEYGFYELPTQPIVDYHTQQVQIPGVLLKKIREDFAKNPIKDRKPTLMMLVNVDRTTGNTSQMVGVAHRDFYLLAAERPFWLNFFKGVIGMWLSYLLVLGIAVACSTYLSGVISWMVTMFLYFCGLFLEHVQELAFKQGSGGGPLEAMQRLIENRPITTPPDDSPLSGLISGGDEFYRWWLKLFINIIPDVNRFDLINYVSSGFDISWGQVLFLDNFIYLAGYLIPWLVLSFYTLKFREIANPT